MSNSNGFRIRATAALLLLALCLSFSPVMAQAVAQTLSVANAIEPHEDGNPLGLSVNHATMGVANLEKQRQFYHDVLGFKIGLFRNRPQFDHQQMHIPGFRLDMISQKGSTRATPSMGTDQQGWLHVDFAVPDADSAYHHLKDIGASVVTGRMDGNKIFSFTVIDPEGNKVEITQPQ